MVLVNNRRYLSHFILLNEAWITFYFNLEKADLDLAHNPGKIIDDGGYIFSLLIGKDIVGACALFNEGNGKFQLARMAVSPIHQGRGYGDVLMSAAMDQLRSLRAHKVYLLSNTRLVAALALYKKHGFSTVSEGQHPEYQRCDIVMERLITNPTAFSEKNYSSMPNS
jgi:ribosomal protein S18 acetylase RimI-like enzyme